MKTIKEFMVQINFPAEAVETLGNLYEEVCANKELSRTFEGVCDMYMTDIDDINGKTMRKLEELAKEYNINEYSLVMLLLVICGQKLEVLYEQKGYDHEYFEKAIDDLRCKLIECHDCYGVWGTFVGGWFHPFYVFERFGVGRFQFDLYEIDDEYELPNGDKVPAGTPVLGMHIPSSGIPLTDEVRYDTYKKAYKFFADRLYKGNLVIECGSWLFYPKHREFLPEKSNILKFMDDFDFVETKERKGFPDIWRIFAGYQDLPYAELPEDNSLRKAYKKHLLETGRSGSGCGIIVFDGEKIINK